jgi:hypothetical protein
MVSELFPVELLSLRYGCKEVSVLTRVEWLSGNESDGWLSESTRLTGLVLCVTVPAGCLYSHKVFRDWQRLQLGQIKSHLLLVVAHPVHDFCLDVEYRPMHIFE